MKSSTGSMALSLVLFAPMVHADPPSLAMAHLRESAPRLRLGIAGTLSAAGALTYGAQGAPTQMTAGAGGCADVGVQLGDPYAVYLHGEAGTPLTHAAAYGVAEWAPIDWLSLGTGIGVDWIQNDPSSASGGTVRGTWLGASIPLIVGFNMGKRPAWLARRSVFRIALEFATGIDARLSPGYHGGIVIGWTLM